MKTMILALTLFASPMMTFAKPAVQEVKLEVTEAGFVPSTIKVKKGTDVVLKVTRKTDVTCATQMKIDGKAAKIDLPLNKEVNVALGKVKNGDVRFACGMDMITGHIIVE